MRRTFLYADRDTFTSAHQEAVPTLARVEDGTCLADVMTHTHLGRTAAMSLLAQLATNGTLYSVHDKVRRHLRYHFDGFDLNPAEACPELGLLLLSTLAISPATALQLTADLRLSHPQVKVTLEALRARGAVFGPRTSGARGCTTLIFSWLHHPLPPDSR